MFITFEGVDGSGKSTQARLLAERLRGDGYEVVGTREPGGTKVGERIRELLLGSDQVAPWAEAMLFSAARAQLVDEVIRPALARGAHVVCDRYIDSSLAYQGLARGLGVERVLEVNLAVTGSLLPDRTFLLVLPGDVAAKRRGQSPDRMEREGDEFAAEVDRAYREIAEVFPERVVVLDGMEDPGELAERIHGHVRDLS
ncbi:MAG TPA: dTMP kinase [Gaiellaceae bacterium]|nr:dTMP kinase [Gaiellaceae bacterium]